MTLCLASNGVHPFTVPTLRALTPKGVMLGPRSEVQIQREGQRHVLGRQVIGDQQQAVRLVGPGPETSAQKVHRRPVQRHEGLVQQRERGGLGQGGGQKHLAAAARRKLVQRFRQVAELVQALQ